MSSHRTPKACPAVRTTAPLPGGRGRAILPAVNSPGTDTPMNCLAPTRSFWALLSVVLGWLCAAPTQGAVHLGGIVISNIGHTFQPAVGTESAVTRDWLIDQGQFSEAMGRLSPV